MTVTHGGKHHGGAVRYGKVGTTFVRGGKINKKGGNSVHTDLTGLVAAQITLKSSTWG